MSERYSRLFTLTENLYTVGSPIVIAAGTLLKDNQTGKIVAQLKLKSISNKTIKAIKIKLDLLDTAGNPLAESVEHDYLDLNVSRDVEFGQKNPVMVPNVKARSYTASVVEVVFVDRSIWTADGNAWEPLSKPQLLCLDVELLKQYRIRFGQSSTYIPKEEKDLWYCTCGTLNHLGEGCHCGNSLFELQAVDMAELAEEKDARLAQEREVAEAKAAAEKAAIEVAKKKTAKILKIVIPIICTLIAFVILLNSVIIPNSKYNNAISLMEEGKFEEAIVAFEELDSYKDSAEQILKCENGMAAVEQARIEAEMAEKFARAEELLAAGDYDGAIAIFESLANYDGSSEGIAAAEEGKLEAAYRAAEALAENGKTAKAAIAFGKLLGYKDARNRSFALWDKIAVRETVSAGQAHTVAIKTDGSVIATGSNKHGQCNVTDWKDIVAVSAGRGHTVGLKSDGTVIAIGYEEGGRLDVGGWKDIVAISARGTHTVGLKCDGTVVVVGYNGDGRCDVETWQDIIAIDAGTYHTVGLKVDGTVLAVGSNEYKQCEVQDWSNIVAISGGEALTVGLRSNGTVVVTKRTGGYADNGKRNVGNWNNIIDICAGSSCNLGVQGNGTVLIAGNTNHDLSGVSKWNNIVAASVNFYHAIGLKADGTVVATGSNEDGRCDISSWKDIKLPN